MTPFLDRRTAGRKLAESLRRFAGLPDAVVLALPRGGVPVAYEVATALLLPLDVFVVRKLGVPHQEELAFGAIAPGGVRVLMYDLIEYLRLTAADVARVTAQEERELLRRDREYREGAPPPAITGQTVILVDDGLATGATMGAAVAAIRAQNPRQIIVAVPVASADAVRALRVSADEVVAVMTPEDFGGVGRWYMDFGQTTDAEVRALLHDANRRPALRAAL
jgi:putative phosphoribosyl transferase